MMTVDSSDYIETLTKLVLDDPDFHRLTMSGRRIGFKQPWEKISIRPFLKNTEQMFQVTFWDGTQSFNENYSTDDIAAPLLEALRSPFKHYHAQCSHSDLQVQITKKGKVIVNRRKPSLDAKPNNVAHNRTKSYLLRPDKPDDYLIAIGIMDHQGKIKPAMQAKFRQINEFLRHIESTVDAAAVDGRPLQMLDCGCGSAYLTFAAYHYFKHIRNIDIQLTGIDQNSKLIKKCIELRDRLAWTDMDFQTSQIRRYTPEESPDIVISLHACDTATDEAIAQGILLEAKGIIAAPCCQSELRKQIKSDALRPLMRHGLLKHRTADIVTDAVRALLLRLMGYKTDVVEFVYPAHTPKNLLIRSVSGLPPGNNDVVNEYKELKEFWGIHPSLEIFLGEKMKSWL